MNKPVSLTPRGRRIGKRVMLSEPTGAAVVNAPKFDSIFADAIEILSLELKRMRMQVQQGKGLNDREARQFNGYLSNIFKVLEDRRRLEERLEGMSDKDIEQLAKLYMQGKGLLKEPHEDSDERSELGIALQDGSGPVTPKEECP